VRFAIEFPCAVFGAAFSASGCGGVIGAEWAAPKEARGMSRGRWALVIAAVCLVVTAAAIAYAAGQATAPVQEVVRAQKFELVDEAGKMRAALAMLPSGAGLGLYDNDGKLRADLLLLSDGGPRLRLLDKEEKPRAGLMLLADGSPALVLYDKDGKARAGLLVSADGSASKMP